MATQNLEQEISSGVQSGDIEVGGRDAQTTLTGDTFVVASYNIRYAVGSRLISGSLGRRIGLARPGRRPRLVASYISKAAKLLSEGRLLPPPDILALQEADRQTIRAGGKHVARELAAHLKMIYAFAPAELPEGLKPKTRQWYLDFEETLQPSEEGRTGVALLSRIPLKSISRVELPWSDCPWRPKLAMTARVTAGKQEIQLFNSHIDPHADIEGQLEQHRAVISVADKAGMPTILLGDFNTLSRRSGIAMRKLLESEGFSTPFPTGTTTWRSGPIRLHTDWIFVRGVAIKRWGVAKPFGISDHWPVWAEVEAGGAQVGHGR